jgi:uncharacterized protein (TIGR03067 family)
MRLFLAVVFAAVLSLVSPPLHADDAKKDHKAIQGTWQVVEFVFNGTTLPEVKQIKIIFKDESMQLVDEKEKEKREYTFKLDSSKTPKAIDLVAQNGPFKDKTGYGIYELKGGELKLCLLNKETKDRPTEFKSPRDSSLALIVLKRAK